MTLPPTPADQRIAALQAAYDAALAAEGKTYAVYMDLPFGTADEAAEVEWLAAKVHSEVLHEDLLAAIDARRDGMSHTSSVRPVAAPRNSSEADHAA